MIRITCLTDRLRLWLLAPLVALAMACVQPTRAQIVTALTDAQWGLAAACGPLQWVPAVDCDVASNGLTTAKAVATQAPADQIKTAVLNTLTATVAVLPADSRAVPYFAYVVAFLRA